MKYALLIPLLFGCVVESAVTDDAEPVDAGLDWGPIDGAPVIDPPPPPDPVDPVDPPPPDPPPPDPTPCDQPEPGACEAAGCSWGEAGCVDLASRPCYEVVELDCVAHDRCNWDGMECLPAVDDCDLRHPNDCAREGRCFADRGRCLEIPGGPCEGLRRMESCEAAWDCRPVIIEGCTGRCGGAEGQGFSPDRIAAAPDAGAGPNQEPDAGISAALDASPAEPPPQCYEAEDCVDGQGCLNGACRNCCPLPWAGCEADPDADPEDLGRRGG